MITGIVIGGEAAVARFNAMPQRLRVELRTGIARAALLVQTKTKTNLSDEVLHVRTGRLRRSVNVKTTATETAVEASIGTNVEYAHIHEYGFSGIESVREHLRTSVLGKSYTVRAHQRQVNVPETSFLRSALAAMSDAIRTEFEQALQRSLL